MNRSQCRFAFLLSATILGCINVVAVHGDEPTADAPVSPRENAIQLFNGKNLDGLYTYLQDTKYDDPRGVFTVRNGNLVISGDGFGGVITKQSYANYRMICEFKWGERTWGDRKQRARDGGVLVHGFGADDGYEGIWMKSIEAQIIDGGIGDIILVCDTPAAGQTGEISATAEVRTERDGETVWSEGGAKRVFCSGRINWFGRDKDWDDTLDFRGPQDIGDPLHEWTTLEVVCDEGNVEVLVNGVVVNKVFDVEPRQGKLTIQSELAEILVRRWELQPLSK